MINLYGFPEDNNVGIHMVNSFLMQEHKRGTTYTGLPAEELNALTKTLRVPGTTRVVLQSEADIISRCAKAVKCIWH